MRVRNHVALLFAILPVVACQGSPPAAPAHASAPAAPQPQEPAAGPAPAAAPAAEAKAAVDRARIRELEQFVAIDRKALEVGETRLEQIRSLLRAGRLTQADVTESELEVLRLRRTLLMRERELAELEYRASGGREQPDR